MTHVITSRAPGPPRMRRWTRQEYYRMVNEGFFDGQRVELLYGRIVEMSPQNYPHSAAVELVDAFVRRAFPHAFRVRIQSPLKLKPASDPEPDMAVVEGSIRNGSDHPTTAVLVVEVADTTLQYDRRKARLYARNGIRDYWVLNLIDRRLEVYRDPIPRGGKRGGPAYANIQVLEPAESVAPLAAPQSTVKVGELLP